MKIIARKKSMLDLGKKFRKQLVDIYLFLLTFTVIIS